MKSFPVSARFHSVPQTLLLLATAALTSPAQTPSPQSPAVDWVRAAVDREVRIINDDGTFPVRYTSHKHDTKGTFVRITIESRQGTVSRTISKDGAPLTPEEQALERKRLQEILDDPDAWAKKQKRNTAARGYATSLVKQMPQSMRWTYTPGQPQLPRPDLGKQIVLDFEPDPSFHPPDIASELLTGLKGRLWIDAQSFTLTRVEGHIIQPVNFGWGGIFAKFFPGGNVSFEQTDAGSNRWIYSHLDEENVTVREFLIHTHVENSQMDATDIHLLPHPIDVREAVHQLLDIPDTH